MIYNWQHVIFSKSTKSYITRVNFVCRLLNQFSDIWLTEKLHYTNSMENKTILSVLKNIR